MSSSRSIKFPFIAAGIAALLGMSIASMRTAAPPKRNPAQDKRDLGLQGAGVGGNFQAGGAEHGGGNPARKTEKSPAPREELPAGDGFGDDFRDQAGGQQAASKLLGRRGSKHQDEDTGANKAGSGYESKERDLRGITGPETPS